MITFVEPKATSGKSIHQSPRPLTGKALLIDGTSRKLITLDNGIAADFLIVDMVSYGYRGTGDGVAYYVRDKEIVK